MANNGWLNSVRRWVGGEKDIRKLGVNGVGAA